MDASVLPDSLDVPPEHALLVVDMRNYSQLPEAKMAPIRADLDDVILNTVFPQSELDDPRSREGAYRDTGDGAICVVPARDTARLVDPQLGHLNAALSRYDQSRLRGGSAICVRVSVHVGPLSLPDHRGDAINEACRLVDSQAVRQAMTAATKHGAYVAPALYLSGEADLTRTFYDPAGLATIASDLRGIIDIPEAGHWVRMERPDDVNTALLDFFKQL
ncbi:alpha/beta hydrolase [Streptomyces sp. NPDC005303]|uniref:alpha/beta fold hydrolase n=1 Tax=Streptomyces sp. NPDC005303 TaxID=3155713 RepID=UPI0033BDCFE5